MSVKYVDKRPVTGLPPRLLTYISERFPLPSYGVAILVFFLCSYLTAQAMSASLWVLNAEVIIGFVTTLLIFFRIRIMDEIKDARDDALYHPERPVPRGLITLRELRIAVISIAFIEIGLNLSLGITTFLAYLIVLAFTLLMYKEFFAGEWLKGKPLLYSATHLMIMPLLALYIYAVQSLNHSGFVTAFLYYLGLSYCVGFLLEISRKANIERKEHDIANYKSSSFRGLKLIYIASGILLTGNILASIIGQVLDFDLYYYVLIWAILFVAIYGFVRYHLFPTRQHARRLSKLYAPGYMLVAYGLIIIQVLTNHL